MADDLDLVLLTEGFPYGLKREPFLEAEIGILAESFRHVFVLPSTKEKGIRPLPSNVTPVDMEWLTPPNHRSKLAALASATALSVLWETLVAPDNIGPYVKSRRMYLELLAVNIIKSRALERFVRDNGLEQAVFYDYWFANSTLALSILRRRGTVRTAAARAHRFDVYDEAWGGRPVAFRESKALGLDLIAPISEHGGRYMSERLRSLQGKVEVHRLGVRDHGSSRGSPSEHPLIVSCGSVIPRKQIRLVPEVLAGLGRPVHWVHFGDGPDRPCVEAACKSLPESVTWELKGHVSNAAVLEFYERTFVDVFLSVSTSEGIPVSMMEAQSFGIPIVAYGGQGIPEIVSTDTGVLVEPGAPIEAVTTATLAALVPERWDRDKIRKLFLSRFLADTNHRRFAARLISLAEANV